MGSSFGCNILTPPGPTIDTSPGAMLSTRQPLAVCPSFSTTGFDPFMSKIARRTSGAMTMPVKRAPASSKLLAISALVSGGRRVERNRGRARMAETSWFGSGSTSLDTAGLLSSFGDTVRRRNRLCHRRAQLEQDYRAEEHASHRRQENAPMSPIYHGRGSPDCSLMRIQIATPRAKRDFALF
jgi:hypothetical protein